MVSYELVYTFTIFIHLFTIHKLVETFFHNKNCNVKVRNILYVLFFLALEVVLFTSSMAIFTLLVNIVFLFLISLCYKSSFQKRILSVSFVCSIGLVIEITSSILFGFENPGLKESTFDSIAILIFIRVFTLIVAYLINKYTDALKEEYIISKIYCVAFTIVLFGTLYLFVAQLTNAYITLMQIIVSGIVLMVVNVTMIMIDEKIYNSMIVEYRQNTLKQHNEALENQMQLIYQSEESIRMLRHDFKNHLMMLSELYNSENVEQISTYISSLLGDLDRQEVAKSNNFVIDSIINFKLNSIKDSDMEINLDVSVPVTINILAHDLTAIIANLLDNAITASEKSEEKILDIRINCKVGNLIILMDNSYNGDIIEENGILKTTNAFRSNHGFGLKSVKHILEKYGGDLRTEYTSNMFSVSVVIPYE